MAEVMPMQIRGRGTAFATAVGNWTVSTLWAQVSPIALASIGWKFYFIFVAFSKSFPRNPFSCCYKRGSSFPTTLANQSVQQTFASRSPPCSSSSRRPNKSL